MEGSGSASSIRVVPATGPAVPGVGKYRYIAVISIDGQAMTMNPVVGRQRRDGAIHVIRVEAPAYEPREESVTFDRSFLVTVELKATAAVPSAKAGPRKWKAAPRGGTGKPGAPGGTLDTENPYQ